MIISLAACSKQPQQIQVTSTPIEKPTLTLPPVDELNMRNVKWVVINEQNVEEVIEQLKTAEGAFAVYALTGEGYGNLGLNFSDIRAMIQQQQAIIAAYEGYYQEAEQALDGAVTVD
jgi:hypothetical protein